MKNYLYYDDGVFINVLNLDEIKQMNENLYNKIMNMNFGTNKYNEYVLAEDMAYKEIYEICSNYDQEQLKQVLKQSFYIDTEEIAKILGNVKKII